MHAATNRRKPGYAPGEMIVECSHCGAPLDVRDGQRFTRCRYCGKTSESRSLRTLEQDTPPGWRPPPVWRPPPHVPADSAVQLSYSAGSAVSGIIVASVLLALIGVGAAVALTTRTHPSGSTGGVGAPVYPGGPKRIDPSALAKVTLRESPEALAEITGVPMSADHSMRVPLAHDKWEAITFQWDGEHLDHVRDLYLNGKTGVSDSAARKAIRAVVGRRLQKDSFQWEGAGIYVSSTNDHVGVNVTISSAGKDEENKLWKQQSEALWKLVRSATLGVGKPPSDDEVRDWLGGGYRLSDLAKLDLATDIDASDAAVRKLFPGAVRQVHIDLEYKVALDHPWYGEAEVQWKNKKGAKVAEVMLRPPPGAPNYKLTDQAAVDACVTASFGKPKKSFDGPHLGGSRDTIWNPAGGGEVRVYEHLVTITLRDSPFSTPMPAAVFTKVVEALDRCGRKAD